MAIINFDSSTVTPQAPITANEPLPVGIYTVEITNSEVKPLKSGNGSGLSLEFTVIEPEQHARRKVWATLSIQHSIEQTERIAKEQLSSLCHAVGIKVLRDDQDLFGKVLKIRTKIRAASGGYVARAEVDGYEAAGAKPTPAAVAPVAAARPWQRAAA